MHREHEPCVSRRLPLGHRAYKPLHNLLTRAGNIVVLDRHPALVVRNRLTGLLYRQVLTGSDIQLVQVSDGFSIAINVNDRAAAEILFERCYAPEETRVLGALLEQIGRFVDVGANYGYFSLLAAARGGPKLSIITAEPNPELAPMIVRSARFNGFNNIEVLPVAVGAEPGTARLAVDRGFTAVARLAGGDDGVVVEVVTVDDLLARLGGEGQVLLKVDVEGHEAAVLRGSGGALEQGAIVTCEVFAESAGPICEHMRSLGYSAYRQSGAEVSLKDWQRHRRLDVVFMPRGQEPAWL